MDVQPEDQVTDGQLFSTESGFRTALNGIYVELSNNALYGGELSVDAVEILAQRYDFSGNTTNAYRLGTYNYTIDYAKSKFAAVWEKAYSLIANCNKLLEYAEKNEEVLTGKMRKMIIGEAMALRAFLHFDMLRLFGPVYATNKADLSIPYNTVYSISATSLLPATQVVEKVLKDLDEAERLLGESDPIIEEGPQNQDSEDGLNYYTYRTQRLNYYAVKALMARVYLWTGQTQKAGNIANELIAHPLLGTNRILFRLYSDKITTMSDDYFTVNSENNLQLSLSQNQRKEFYETEITLRKQLKYPPFCDIIIIGFNSLNEAEIKKVSNKVYEYLTKKLNNEEFKTFKPMPSPIDKIQNRFRYRIIIKAKMTEDINIILNQCLKNIYQKDLKSTRISIDVNPNNMS